MNNLAFTHHTAQHRPPSTSHRMIAEVLLEFRRKPIACDTWIGFVLRPVDRCAVCITQSRSRLDQGIQYRLKIESGAADDLKHIGGGGLLLERFAQLVEQPGGLAGDDGLRGGNLDQLALLVWERAHLPPLHVYP